MQDGSNHAASTNQLKIRKSSSQNRYSDEKYRESMCEPNELVQQLKMEQEFEYASHQSSLNVKQGPLIPK